MTSAASKAAQLRALLATGPVVAPFVFDGLQGRLAERAGFSVLYLTGFGTAASHGLPDLGLVGMSEMAATVAVVAAATGVPVVADADTGYGGVLNVMRTVRAYERAGAAGLHIEDQVWPKRCGFFAGKEVIGADVMVAKVRAACDARTSADTVIIARTDALAPHGWDDVEQRARAYRAAGADLIFFLSTGSGPSTTSRNNFAASATSRLSTTAPPRPPQAPARLCSYTAGRWHPSSAPSPTSSSARPTARTCPSWPTSPTCSASSVSTTPSPLWPPTNRATELGPRQTDPGRLEDHGEGASPGATKCCPSNSFSPPAHPLRRRQPPPGRQSAAPATVSRPAHAPGDDDRVIAGGRRVPPAPWPTTVTWPEWAR
jgi:hypothetical protein